MLDKTMLPGAALDRLGRVRTVKRVGYESGAVLRVCRKWFADDDDQMPPIVDSPEDILELPGWAQTVIRSLRTESAERRKRLKALENTVAENERKRHEEEATRLAEQGQWKTLAEQRAVDLERLKGASERAEALEFRIKAANEARIAKIPADMQTIIPTDYDPIKLSEWLDANESKLVKPSAPDLEAGRRGNGGNKPPIDPKKAINPVRF